MKPPIKWMGAKKKLSSRIIKKFPKDFNTYFELFAGSAVLLFNLEPKHSVISDINKELINFYEVLRDDLNSLLIELNNLEIDEKSYYKIRNADRESSWPVSKLKRAARFLYLNRACFNGVWRINSQGFYNVPWGKKSKIDYKIDILKQTSNFLKNVKLYTEDFEFFLPMIKKDDLVYLDPPYAVNANSGESNYNHKSFDQSDQIRLVNFCKELDKKGTRFVLSNSYSEETKKLYKDFNVEIVNIRRCVGSLSKTRKIVQEIIVDNA